jgi:DNA-binding PucR family transcriptional regulator
MFRELVATIESDPGWIGSVAMEITEEIHRELPELNADPEIRESTLASTESVLRLWIELVRLDRPPSDSQLPLAADNYARDLVHRGISVDKLLRSYHVGQSVFFRRWLDHVQTLPHEETRSTAIEHMVSWMFDYIQVLSRGLVAAYTAEREAWIRSAAALRSETVTALLAGEPVDPRAAATRLRYELDREHLAFVVWSDREALTGELGTQLERAALELGTRLGATSRLIAPLTGQLVAVWINPPAGGVPSTLGLDSSDAAGIRVAFGSPANGVAGFTTSHNEAMHARRVAKLSTRRPGSVTHYRDVALTALSTGDLDLARHFVETELGALAAQDDETLRLSATLRVYLEENASPRRAAQRLGVHENTVKGRIKAIGEQLPHPPTERVAELLVALRLARLTHREPAA